jgi:cytochrome P450
MNGKLGCESIGNLCQYGRSFDPSYEMIIRLTLIIICEAAMEYNISKEEVESFRHNVRICLEEFTGRQTMNPLRKVFGWLIPSVRTANASARAMQEFCYRILQAYLDNPNKSSNITVIKLLMETLDDVTTDNEHIAEIFGFLFTGHDTTGFTLASTVLNMTKHTEHVRKLREDLEKTKDGKTRSYLQHFIKESHRVCSVIPTGATVMTSL